ncbi:hypothetical protein KM043_001978 [Ampulex compressa]|nr:hypothetical protein KM043_001978 [Ampulex compressa]
MGIDSHASRPRPWHAKRLPPPSTFVVTSLRATIALNRDPFAQSAALREPAQRDIRREYQNVSYLGRDISNSNISLFVFVVLSTPIAKATWPLGRYASTLDSAARGPLCDTILVDLSGAFISLRIRAAEERTVLQEHRGDTANRNSHLDSGNPESNPYPPEGYLQDSDASHGVNSNSRLSRIRLKRKISERWRVEEEIEYTCSDSASMVKDSWSATFGEG